MTKSFLYVERIRASFQEKGCVGVAQGVKIEQRHVQLLVNDAIRMLQGARLYVPSSGMAYMHTNSGEVWKCKKCGEINLRSQMSCKSCGEYK